MFQALSAPCLLQLLDHQYDDHPMLQLIGFHSAGTSAFFSPFLSKFHPLVLHTPDHWHASLLHLRRTLPCRFALA